MNKGRLSNVLYEYRAYRINEVDVFRAFIEELGQGQAGNGRCAGDVLDPVVVRDGCQYSKEAESERG
jgi:hypothetical protein